MLDDMNSRQLSTIVEICHDELFDLIEKNKFSIKKISGVLIHTSDCFGKYFFLTKKQVNFITNLIQNKNQ